MISNFVQIVFLIASFTQFSFASELPVDFYNPINTSDPASHLKCIGEFYGRNQQEPYNEGGLFLTWDNPLVLPFDENGNVSLNIEGNSFNLGLGASQEETSSGSIDIFDIYLTVQVKETSLNVSDSVDLFENKEVAHLKMDGNDHLRIDCYPVLLN